MSLTSDEIVILMSLFLDDSNKNVNFHLKDQFKWKHLLTFVKKYNINGQSLNDPLFFQWISKVVPSCVYSGSTELLDGFTCVFCRKQYQRSNTLILHYKNIHHCLLPINIFGSIIKYNCEICKKSYNELKNLNRHLKSKSHNFCLNK